MEALEYKKGKTVVLELHGRVDEFNTGVLRDELQTVLNTGKFFIAIDLSKTTFLSAHCLKAIWAIQKKARSLGGELVLSGAGGEVLETIHWVGYDTVVRRFQEVEEACVALQIVYDKAVAQRLKQSSSTDLSVLEGNSTDNLNTKHRSRFSLLSLSSISHFWARLAGMIHKKKTWGWLFFFVGTGIFGNSAPASAQSPLPSPMQTDVSKNSYTLEEVLSLAREASPQIKMARLKMIEREADVKIAKSFGLPRIVGTTGYLYQSNPTIVGEIVNREINNVRNQSDNVSAEQIQTRTKFQIEKDSMLMGFGFGQVVYSGGLYKNQVNLKIAQRNEAEALVSVETLSIEEQVRNLFIGLMLVKEKINLLKARLEATSSRLVAIQRAREARTVNAIQVAELEVQSLKAEQELLDSQREERSARGLLNIGLGRPADAQLWPVAAKNSKEFALQSAEHYYEIAVHRYPELRRSMALMDSAAAYLKIVDAQSVFSPQAMVFGSMEYTQGLGTVKKDLSWSVGLGVVVPLYDGNKSSAEFEKATSLASQARIAYGESERKLKIEIAEVVSRIEQTRLQKRLALKTVEIAKNRRTEAEGAVGEGQIPQYRLVEVQAHEIEARISVIAADAELYKWQARLLLLTGQRE